jgi:hypothetical protein
MAGTSTGRLAACRVSRTHPLDSSERLCSISTDGAIPRTFARAGFGWFMGRNYFGARARFWTFNGGCRQDAAPAAVVPPSRHPSRPGEERGKRIPTLHLFPQPTALLTLSLTGCPSNHSHASTRVPALSEPQRIRRSACAFCRRGGPPAWPRFVGAPGASGRSAFGCPR